MSTLSALVARRTELRGAVHIQMTVLCRSVIREAVRLAATGRGIGNILSKTRFGINLEVVVLLENTLCRWLSV